LKNWKKTINHCIFSTCVGLSLSQFDAQANEIGNIPTSGFFFKDTLKINSFNDPKIPGVTLFLADYDRPLTEKLSKGSDHNFNT
jgi:catabolite regulation protein CreA